MSPGTSGLLSIVVDIEGTTTPIAFVHRTLFPYARNKLPQYLQLCGRAPECQGIFDRLRQEHDADAQGGLDVPDWSDDTIAARHGSIERYVAWLMDRDRKSTPLKDLQGRIWEEGYRTGELVGEVFDDVEPAFRQWHEHGIGIGIFSSGSVLAQKLLFRHSSAGDLTRFVRWHFDTTIGPKTTVDSYGRIVSIVDVPPAAILFISDSIRELDAAHAVGLRTALSLRPGNAPTADAHGHPTIRRFDELTI